MYVCVCVCVCVRTGTSRISQTHKLIACINVHTRIFVCEALLLILPRGGEKWERGERRCISTQMRTCLTPLAAMSFLYWTPSNRIFPAAVIRRHARVSTEDEVQVLV